MGTRAIDFFVVVVSSLCHSVCTISTFTVPNKIDQLLLLRVYSLRQTRLKTKNNYGAKVQIKEGVRVLMKTSMGRIPGNTVLRRNLKMKRGHFIDMQKREEKVKKVRV